MANKPAGYKWGKGTGSTSKAPAKPKAKAKAPTTRGSYKWNADAAPAKAKKPAVAGSKTKPPARAAANKVVKDPAGALAYNKQVTKTNSYMANPVKPKAKRPPRK